LNCTGRQIGNGEAVNEAQGLRFIDHAGSDGAADKAVVGGDGGGIVIESDEVGAGFERVTHRHGVQRLRVLLPAGVVSPAGPVVIVHRPLFATEPFGLVPRIPVRGRVLSFGKLVATDEHIGALVRPGGHAQFPADDVLPVGLGGDGDAVEMIALRFQRNGGVGVAIHHNRGGCMRAAIENKGA